MSNPFSDPNININFEFISELEGGSLTEGYVPDPKNSKSGVTVAIGFDLGARNQRDMQALGLSASVIEKLSPYLGLQGMRAKEYLDQHPLSLTENEADAIDEAVKFTMARRVIDEYNLASDMDFSMLPGNWQTVIASVAFQYGSLARKCPSFFSCVIKQDWQKATAELRNFGDRYRTRRNKEADYAEQH
jgi:hypothetical protein